MSILRLQPRLIEGGVFHALSAVHEVAVHAVNRAVTGLDDCWIVVGAAFVLFQVSFPFPSLSFVVGNRNGKAIAAVGRIVVDKQPMAVGESDAIDSGAGVLEFCRGYGAPGQAIIHGDAGSDSLFGAVFAHIRDELAIIAAEHGWLDGPKAEQWLACIPGFASIVANRHDRYGECIRVKR